MTGVRRTAIALAALALGLVACMARTPAVRYEPAVVTLSGTLMEVHRWGPPTFGEDSTRDESVRLLVLSLGSAISVVGDSADPVNSESIPLVTQVQLALAEGMRIDSLLGRRVRLTGTLSRAVTGHHFFPVIMAVQAILPGG